MTFTPRFNPQLKDIQVSLIRKFDDQTGKIPGILKLTLGEPDFNTPTEVKNAGISAIEEDFSHYSHNRGLMEVRQAASDFVSEKYGLHYEAETEVITTVGATEALATSLLAILEKGDKVLIPTPNYPGYEPLVTLAGGEVVYIDTTEDDFILTLEKLKAAVTKHGSKVKALILNDPANPTGTVYPEERVQELAEYLQTTDIFVVADEVYSELTYEKKHVSFGNYLREQTLVINGLSKSHAMTGWRMGFIFAPKELCQELVKVHQYLVTAATTISQKAAVAALTVGKNDSETMKTAYEKRRNYLVDALNALGFSVQAPAGAFYLFVKIPENLPQDSFEFCLALAQKGQLAVIPGISFGKAGEGYFRISYAADLEKLEEAMRRLEKYLQG